MGKKNAIIIFAITFRQKKKKQNANFRVFVSTITIVVIVLFSCQRNPNYFWVETIALQNNKQLNESHIERVTWGCERVEKTKHKQKINK